MSEKDGPIFHGLAHDALQFGHVDLVNVEEVVHELLLGPQFLVGTLLKKVGMTTITKCPEPQKLKLKSKLIRHNCISNQELGLL